VVGDAASDDAASYHHDLDVVRQGVGHGRLLPVSIRRDRRQDP
jgi:hypothetical protein